MLLPLPLLLVYCGSSWWLLTNEGFCSASDVETFMRFAADPPTGSELLEIASTSYRLISKFVTAFTPRNLIAAMS